MIEMEFERRPEQFEQLKAQVAAEEEAEARRHSAAERESSLTVESQVRRRLRDDAFAVFGLPPFSLVLPEVAVLDDSTGGGTPLESTSTGESPRSRGISNPPSPSSADIAPRSPLHSSTAALRTMSMSSPMLSEHGDSGVGTSRTFSISRPGPTAALPVPVASLPAPKGLLSEAGTSGVDSTPPGSPHAASTPLSVPSLTASEAETDSTHSPSPPAQQQQQQQRTFVKPMWNPSRAERRTHGDTFLSDQRQRAPDNSSTYVANVLGFSRTNRSSQCDDGVVRHNNKQCPRRSTSTTYLRRHPRSLSRAWEITLQSMLLLRCSEPPPTDLPAPTYGGWRH